MQFKNVENEVLVENTEELTKEWLTFLKSNSGKFKKKGIEKKIIKRLKKFKVCELWKYMYDLETEQEELCWKVHLTLEYKGSELELDTQETEIAWYDFGYKEGADNVEEYFEENVNEDVREYVLNAFLTEALSPKYKLHVYFDEKDTERNCYS